MLTETMKLSTIEVRKMNPRRFLLTLFSLVFGIGISLGIAALLGENPFHVLNVILKGALGSPTQFGYSLFYATPLLLTGLAVSWAFRAGLFNIGVEGQMTLGGVTMAAIGISFPNLPVWIALPFAFVGAFAVGGLWAAMAGWIKAKRGCHEVLTTILLNFIAYGLSSFLILSVFKNRESQVPETSVVGAGFKIAPMAWLGGMSPLNWSLVFGLVTVAIYGFIFKQTKFGFLQKMNGGAREVGRRAGTNMDTQTILAMFVSGGLAAWAAASPVLGFAFKAREGFPSGAGFVGIAVALLGRGRPLGIIASAILFGVLTKGALDLDLDTDKVSRDLSVVIQALIVLAVASQAGFERLWDHFSRRREKPEVPR